jgi:alkylation response protein AidB-like acyl-CoA dehydrogenase
VDFSLSDEQRNFVEAIRDFCRRECGTTEQRERLTNGYSEAHSAELYSKMAELGWLGVTIEEDHGGSGARPSLQLGSAVGGDAVRQACPTPERHWPGGRIYGLTALPARR